MKTVAIDARRTRRMSVGVRAYVDGLLDHLAAAAPDLRVVTIGRGGNFGLAEHVELPAAIVRSGADLVHFPTTFAPLVRPRPYVLTIHDLIHLRYPEQFGRATALHYRLVGLPLARGARRLLVGDERTVADCERFARVPPERCRVVPLGYDPALLEPDAQPLRTDRPFILYAGNRRPHKNLAALFAAWTALPAGRELDLRITGPADPSLERAHTRPGGRLICTGQLTFAELRRHYRAALAYVHPAWCEGFGIPMLEAAVLGTPVIAARDALPGIVAPFAVPFAATDVGELAALLDALTRDRAPFAARAAEGVPALRAYTWHRFAAATAAVYREVLE